MPKLKLRISKALGLDKQCADVGITKFTTELARRSFEAVQGSKMDGFMILTRRRDER